MLQTFRSRLSVKCPSPCCASDLVAADAYDLPMRLTADHLDPAERDALLAALAWQAELGVDECIGEMVVDRFGLPDPVAQPRVPESEEPGQGQTQPPTRAPAQPQPDQGIAAARMAASAAQSLDDLRAAMEAFDGCALQKGARTTVFADGNPAARVMIIGEAPGPEEDRSGRPFVGRSGHLLDRMLAAIGLSRTSEDPASAVYIANAIPWRPVGNREPSADETEMMWAFLERHIQLAKPEFIVTMGRAPASMLMQDSVRVRRIHGQWYKPARAQGHPFMPTLHPTSLLRLPAEKARAWGDLLNLRAALDGAALSFEG